MNAGGATVKNTKKDPVQRPKSPAETHATIEANRRVIARRALPKKMQALAVELAEAEDAEYSSDAEQALVREPIEKAMKLLEAAGYPSDEESAVQELRKRIKK